MMVSEWSWSYQVSEFPIVSECSYSCNSTRFRSLTTVVRHKKTGTASKTQRSFTEDTTKLFRMVSERRYYRYCCTKGEHFTIWIALHGISRSVIRLTLTFIRWTCARPTFESPPATNTATQFRNGRMWSVTLKNHYHEVANGKKSNNGALIVQLTHRIAHYLIGKRRTSSED